MDFKKLHPLISEHFDEYDGFVKTLLELNRQINLVSRDMDLQTFWVKHILDSILVSEYFDFSKAKSLLDIGSGGGIPGIPLKITHPHLEVALLDSTEKKMRAVGQIADTCKVSVETIVGRTEELGHIDDLRENFDIVTARAVAPLPTLLEYALPFVRVGGHFIAFKGRNFKEELAESLTAIKKLGGKLIERHVYILPESSPSGESQERAYLVFEKVAKCPNKYPRHVGVPKKSPLI